MASRSCYHSRCGLAFSVRSPVASRNRLCGNPEWITSSSHHSPTSFESGHRGGFQNTDGLLAPAKLALNVGWYRFGSLPGEKGNAVIAGAVHWKYGSTAVFGDVHFLKLGDAVVVQNDRGELVTFIVRGLKTYEINADISELFRSSDGLARLILITSDGSWDAPSKSYSRRLVVFAEKEAVAVDASVSRAEKSESSSSEVFPDSYTVTTTDRSDIAWLTGSIYGH